jgi:caffeoyl-CoA O-methyltransferase|tara:strand:- start:248 stop:880 length:633 start_codon:yes stop_codon:yes gene_type:complete
MIDIVPKGILDYCEDHSTGEPDIYKKITELTYNKEEIPQMLSGNMVGNVLQLLLKLMNAKNVLELGTFTGYSALKLAEVIPDNGTVTTIDITPSPIAEIAFEEAEWGNRIIQLTGEALSILSKINDEFDFMFVDADKRNYPNYYKTGKSIVKAEGLMVFDNALWDGSVVDPKDEQTKAIDETNKLAKNDPTVFNQILPIRDGLLICQKLV